jgi:hypothetical protein
MYYRVGIFDVSCQWKSMSFHLLTF